MLKRAEVRTDFTKMPNEIIWDASLSLEAKGLFLLAKSLYWSPHGEVENVPQPELMKYYTPSRANANKKKDISRVFQQLCLAGYARLRKEHINGHWYTFYDFREDKTLKWSDDEKVRQIQSKGMQTKNNLNQPNEENRHSVNRQPSDENPHSVNQPIQDTKGDFKNEKNRPSEENRHSVNRQPSEGNRHVYNLDKKIYREDDTQISLNTYLDDSRDGNPHSEGEYVRIFKRFRRALFDVGYIHKGYEKVMAMLMEAIPDIKRFKKVLLSHYWESGRKVNMFNPSALATYLGEAERYIKRNETRQADASKKKIQNSLQFFSQAEQQLNDGYFSLSEVRLKMKQLEAKNQEFKKQIFLMVIATGRNGVTDEAYSKCDLILANLNSLSSEEIKAKYCFNSTADKKTIQS